MLCGGEWRVPSGTAEQKATDSTLRPPERQQGPANAWQVSQNESSSPLGDWELEACSTRLPGGSSLQCITLRTHKTRKVWLQTD